MDTSPVPPATTPAVTDATAKNKKTPRYPPLVVEKLPNWATHFKAVKAKLGYPPNARPYQGGIRFSPESENEYRVIQHYLVELEKESGLSWFAYSLPAERSFKVAIRGIPADTEPEEIEEELRTLGFEPEYVRNINARGGVPGCIFYVVLRKTPDVNRIFDTNTFMCMRGVKIEAWRGRRGPAQCHRCQKFRHSSQQCHRPLACVRCGEAHAARDCPRPRTDPPTCVNCAGPHPASNKQCPVFLAEQKAKRAGTTAQTKRSRQAAATTAAAPQPANAEDNEAPSTSLMAAANGPPNRDAPPPRRRGKRRGGKRVRKKPPPPTIEEEDMPQADLAPIPAQAASIPTPAGVQAEPQKGAKKVGAKAAVAIAPPTTTQQPTSRAILPDQRRGPQVPAPNAEAPHTGGVRNKEFTAGAIQLLMGLIKAIRQGEDPEQIILDGLVALLTLYHG